MRTLSPAIVVIIWLLMMPELKGQVIYLVNESFESTAVPPSGWVYTTGVQHSANRARTGNRSVRFSSNDHSIRTPLLTNPGELSLWLNRTSGRNLNVQVQWHTNPNASVWNTVATIQGTNNTWIQYTTEITTNPSFTTKTNIYIRIRSNSGTRMFYIDDFTVTSTAPIPDFTATPIEGDIGENITFTDNSSGTVTSWNWNFGAGADPPNATTQGPHNVSYSSAGFKTISLTVNGTYTETKTDYISIATIQQSATETYTGGDISTDYGFQSLPGQSSCPGILTVSVPIGATITSVDVSYNITAQNWGWMSEQRSQLRCISPGGTAETTLAQGSGNSGGTFVYNRTGLDIANGISGGGDIVFELHTGRTWGGSGCNTTYNKVDNNTWTITVYFSEVPYADFTADPLIAGTSETVVFTDQSSGGTFTSWDWDFGAGANPPGANTQGPHMITYSTEGFKTISLTVDGIYTETKTNYVHITNIDCLHWDDGTNYTDLGRESAGIFQIASRYEPSDLLGYSSHQITSIKLFVSDLPTAASVKIWQGVNQAGLIEYLSQSFTPVAGSWNEIELTTPYPVDPNLELWFGAEFQDPGQGISPAGVDEFTQEPGKSNMFRLNNNDNLSWAPLSNYAINGDWNVQACLQTYIPASPFNPPRLLSAEVINGNDVVLNWYSPDIDEGFELYTDFALSFGNWTQNDLDEDGTWGSTAYDFPNEFYTGSFIIFTPSETTPPATDPDWQPYSGDKFAACFAANPGPNDDWLITPQIKVANGDQLSFFHRSVVSTYGLERFRVGISTTGTNTTDFTIITPAPYIESPASWTLYSYDLSTYQDQEIYIAINCVSDDSFVFMLDDFVVSDAKGNEKFALELGMAENTNPKIHSHQCKANNGYAIQPTRKEKSTRLFASYKIYRDNIEIDEVSGFSFTDLTVAPGLHNYYVTAVYTDPADESDSSNVVEVNIGENWIWTGTVSSVWETAGNWNTGTLPHTTSNVIIPPSSNNPLITSQIMVNDLQIESGAALTIDPSGNLTVNGTLLNEQGQNGLIIASSAAGTGSLIHSTPGVPATSQRYVPGEPEAWHILSSPMTNQGISDDFTPAGTYADGTGYDFYTWYEPDTSWVYLLNTDFSPTWAEAHAGNNFIPGKGYLVAYQASNPTLNFSGVLNTGYVSVGITSSNISGDPFGANLIGNPYPSAIDWKATSGWSRNDLILSGGGHDIWIWNDTAYNYGVYNSASVNDEGTLGVSRFIAVNQGFFVLAGQTGSLAMDYDVRVHQGAGNWLKATRKFTDIIFLTVESKNKNGTDEVMIEMGIHTEPHGTPKRFSFVQSAPGLFITKNGNFFSALLGNDKNKTPVVPVSFTPGQNGEFTLKASMDEDFIEMAILHDKQTGTQHDLKMTAEYNFQAKKDDDPARFILQLKEGNFPDPHQQIPVSIFTHNKRLYVDMRLTETNCELNIYDVTGRGILNRQLNGGVQHEIELPYKHGVYIVYLSDNNGSVSKKIIF
jgi:PKD repeat protein